MQPSVSSTRFSCIVNSSLSFRYTGDQGLSWPDCCSRAGQDSSSALRPESHLPMLPAGKTCLASPLLSGSGGDSASPEEWAGDSISPASTRTSQSPAGLVVLSASSHLLPSSPTSSLCLSFAPGLFTFLFNLHLIPHYPLKGPVYLHFSAHELSAQEIPR